MHTKRLGEKGAAVSYICLFILGAIIVGGFVFHYSQRECVIKYVLINKDLVCGEGPKIDKRGYAALQKEIEGYINEKKTSGDISEAAFYFRDLLDGPVFGINEFTDFAPASLLKLPFVLTYLKESEELGPQMLQESLLFIPTNSEFVQSFSPEETLKAGESYTVEDLLRRMLSFSDNNSSDLLAAQLQNTGRENIVRETLLELGILAPDDPFDKVVSVRRYGSIFRGLYNSSLLSKENSNKVLDWLSQSKFKDGLVVGVPASVKIAHKFGERLLEDNTKQLHDCGIVYYPDNPYLLCVMTHGTDYVKLQKVIQDISKMVYTEVDSRRL